MIFDGKEFAKRKETELRGQAERLKSRGITPKMISILADISPESRLYVSLKDQFAKKIGVIYEVHEFESSATTEIVGEIKKANLDPLVHGIMVQLPVVNEKEVVAAISPEKDVDCLTPTNLGLIFGGQPKVLPATVKAVMEILTKIKEEETGQVAENKWLAGEKVVIIGASIIVGKPLAIMLSDLGATVTICRSRTENLAEETKKADILISATGVAGLITKEMVKPRAIVVDVGISKLLRGGKFQVLGDVEKEALERASFFTPVPGGVGPVTMACLFENLLQAIGE